MNLTLSLILSLDSRLTCGSFKRMPAVWMNSHPRIRRSSSISGSKPSCIDGVGHIFSSGSKQFSKVSTTRLYSQALVAFTFLASAIFARNNGFQREKSIPTLKFRQKVFFRHNIFVFLQRNMYDNTKSFIWVLKSKYSEAWLFFNYFF